MSDTATAEARRRLAVSPEGDALAFVDGFTRLGRYRRSRGEGNRETKEHDPAP